MYNYLGCPRFSIIVANEGLGWDPRLKMPAAILMITSTGKASEPKEYLKRVDKIVLKMVVDFQCW